MADATNINILNSIRSVMPLAYQERIPQANAENINTVYDRLQGYTPYMNEVCNALVTLIVSQRIDTMVFNNPLGVLKKEPMSYGDTEEEIFVNMVKGHNFNQFASVNELYKYYKSNVMSAYHKVSPALQYAVTITFDNLRNAFTSEYGIRNLINAKVSALYASANWDEYLQMRELVESAYNNRVLYPVTIKNPVDADTATALTVAMKTYIGKMQFPNTALNIAGATSCSNESSIYYITTPEIDAQLDVNVLANAFNLGKVDINARKIIVDEFKNSHIKAVLFDMRFFNVKDIWRTMTDSRNGANLTWNYFYSVCEMFSYSPFFPVVVFTDETFDVTSIEVADAEGTKGGIVEITAVAISDSNVPSQLLEYEVEGNKSGHTAFIAGTNRLVIGTDETAEELTVTVTSRFDSSIKATATVSLV